MWTRKQLKERGNKAFKANYWKCVLVGLIFTIVAGGSAGYHGGSTGGFSAPTASGIVGENGDADIDVDVDEDVDVDLGKGKISVEVDDDNDDAVKVDIDGKDITDQIVENNVPNGAIVAAIIVGAIIVLVITVVIMAIAFAISAFLLNPFEMGCNRFFYKNLDDETTKLSNVVFAFDHNYINTVKILFFRDLYVTLWSFLFVIPGIIKAYEYRMLPYIIQDNPDISKEDAFALSKQMMTGNKWKAFVLDLSFIGWHILSLFTCGLLSIFYVNPYQCSTNAALYEALKVGNDVQEEVVYEA